ncbi:potassium transporter Kup [Candidatus Methylospira mobilis]|uniref:Probable potassium transport system protein Kup n=1 Tax=Candidatus Methylospira mobilis TaxID=1808979 RepID=A0A5Q0BMB5_9GAMM|nr:potassium transporter Kup [Candidatus Methylospira mobilis]QFY43258.1 potassium transporter Kup [Candidatus Methylospira mobilis]WNV03543.1 potassium transporter Kup [Candidatus Methylospira mobilis]
MPSHTTHSNKNHFFLLSLGALGIVYGDIGTSPLYSMKEIFSPAYGLALTSDNVLGILSLIFWALTIIISLKYVIFVMRADNKGEGGIMALMALALHPRRRRFGKNVIIAIGLFGTALFYGDGIITPAISVLSAVEGLEIAAPSLHPYIVPITLIVLIALFSFQRYGTARVGNLFGPIMLVWFLVLAWLGSCSIYAHPMVLQAVNPTHAVKFFLQHGSLGFFALGAVVLAFTGAEALYADMGHFGKKPIQLSWFFLVFPALILNYFGQGALLLRDPLAVENPFYLLTPQQYLYPMIGLSTVATVIASQAVISGAYSITQQAIRLGYLPRMHMQHTSSTTQGQIYVPAINNGLLILIVLVVLAFKESSNLAAAYGIAVTGTMVITTMLVTFVAIDTWKWPRPVAGAVFGCLLFVDAGFFCANAVKIPHGGWFPVLAGLILFSIMSVWKKGRRVLTSSLQRTSTSLSHFIEEIKTTPPLRVPGTSIFLYSHNLSMPYALYQNLRHNKILHEKVVLLTAKTFDVPYVAERERFHIEDLGFNFYRITLHFGFMEVQNIPRALTAHEPVEPQLDIAHALYFLGRETLIPSDNPGLSPWQERLFVLLFRNASSPIIYFGLPTDRAIELGALVRI